MKKTLFVPVLAMAAALSVSCSKEETEGVENGPVNGGEAALFAPQSVISASSAATKTALDGVDINWEEGDAITLFGEDDAPVKYTLTGGAGTTVGTFEAEGELPAQVQAYAVYPAVAEGVTLSGNKVAISVAAEQTYNAAGFPAEYPMAAVTSDGQNFLFENLATVLRVSLTGTATLSSIVVEAAGIAGDASIDFSGEIPELTPGSSSAVTLKFPESGYLVLSEGENVFSFIVVPGSYSELKFTINETNGNVTTKTAKLAEGNIDLAAGDIADFDLPLEIKTPQGWNLVGGFVGNWSSWIEMDGGNGLYYCTDVTVPEDSDFKIRYGANQWYGFGLSGSENFVTLQKIFRLYVSEGENNQGNVSVVAGTYDFYFVENDHDVIVMPAGVAPFVLTGTFNEWGETPFEIVDGLMIAKNISFDDNDAFKIKLAKMSDDDNWNGGYNLGSNGQPITPGENYNPINGTNDNISISVAGIYDITFDIKNNSIIMTASQN